jgi:hypothetical protein
MINKFRLIISNYVFQTGFVISVFGIIVCISMFVAGHLIINKIIVAKSGILNLADATTAKRYRQLGTDYNTTKNERLALMRVRPSKQEIVYFVQALDGLAARSQVIQTVEVTANGSVKDEIKYSVPSIRYKLNVSGSLVSVMNYLRDLNKMPYLLRFVSIEVAAAEEKSLTDATLGTIIIDIASK